MNTPEDMAHLMLMKINKPGRIISLVLLSVIICLAMLVKLLPDILITQKDVIKTTIATASVKPDFNIPVSESELKWSARKSYNSTLRVFHFIKHGGKVIEYLKWDKEMHKRKNLPIPLYERNLFIICIILIIIIPIIIVALKHARKIN